MTKMFFAGWMCLELSIRLYCGALALVPINTKHLVDLHFGCAVNTLVVLWIYHLNDLLIAFIHRSVTVSFARRRAWLGSISVMVIWVVWIAPGRSSSGKNPCLRFSWLVQYLRGVSARRPRSLGELTRIGDNALGL